jgi:hypothetical protein
VLDDDGTTIVSRQLLGCWPKFISACHEFKDKAPILECAQDLSRRDGLSIPTHGSHPSKERCGHLAIEIMNRFGDGLGWRQPADDGVWTAIRSSASVELDRFFNRVLAGGGGNVDKLLDIPMGRLRAIRGDIERPIHP